MLTHKDPFGSLCRRTRELQLSGRRTWYEVKAGHGGDGISLRFKSSALDLPKDLATGGYLPPPSVALSLASGERVSPRSKSWKIKAPPPSRFEKRHHPGIDYEVKSRRSGSPT